MKAIEPFKFTPHHQPDESNLVEFRLKPLDFRGQYEVQASIDDRGIAGWEGVQVASRFIVGWSGDRLGPFSRARVNQIITGGADADWMVWMMEITGKLYRESLLSEDEEKKSNSPSTSQ